MTRDVCARVCVYARVCVSSGGKILPPRLARGSFRRLISNNVDKPFSQCYLCINAHLSNSKRMISFRLSFLYKRRDAPCPRRKSHFCTLSTSFRALLMTRITDDVAFNCAVRVTRFEPNPYPCEIATANIVKTSSSFPPSCLSRSFYCSLS